MDSLQVWMNANTLGELIPADMAESFPLLEVPSKQSSNFVLNLKIIDLISTILLSLVPELTTSKDLANQVHGLSIKGLYIRLSCGHVILPTRISRTKLTRNSLLDI